MTRCLEEGGEKRADFISNSLRIKQKLMSQGRDRNEKSRLSEVERKKKEKKKEVERILDSECCRPRFSRLRNRLREVRKLHLAKIW